VADRESDPLLACIDLLRNRLQKYRGRSLGEQNTKASLIEPLLESLGWDIRDFDEVHHEFKAKRADRPVDYALQLAVKPRVFIEAKGLGENLSDRKWVAQILGYATVAGVTWCVLTDGDEYRLYNATAPVDADEKLFCKVRITDEDRERLIGTLRLISRASVASDSLAPFWKAHFVDRNVMAALQGVVDPPDRALVRLIRRQLPEFTDKQIVDSIGRLNIDVRSGAPFQIPQTSAANGAPLAAVLSKEKIKRQTKSQRQGYGVTLQQVIKAGLLPTPLSVFRKYKGTVLKATLHADGSIEFKGQKYESCSRAAEQALRTISGQIVKTNGWKFWQYVDDGEKAQELRHARAIFLKGTRQP